MAYRNVYTFPSTCNYQEGVGNVCEGGATVAALPEYIGAGYVSEFCYYAEACLLLGPDGGPVPWWRGAGYYGPLYTREGNYQGEYGNEWSSVKLRDYFGDTYTTSLQWLAPDGYWMHPVLMYGFAGDGFVPGNAVQTRTNIENILAPFGADVMELADAAAWTIYMQQVAINGAAGWTPANANPAAIMDYVILTALSAPQFAGDKRASAILAYLDTAEWQAKIAAGWEQAAQVGRYHAAANESNSVLQGFVQAFSKFMMVAGPLMAVTGAFAAVLAAVQNGIAAGAAVGMPELGVLDALKAGYQVAEAANPESSILPVNPFNIISQASSVGGMIASLTDAGIAAGELAAPALLNVTIPSESIMPLGQDDFAYSDFAGTSYSDYMGMDTGNLGLDVPQLEFDYGTDPLAGTYADYSGDFSGGYEPAEIQLASGETISGYVDAEGNVYDSTGTPLLGTAEGYVPAEGAVIGSAYSLGIDDPASTAAGAAEADRVASQVDQSAPVATQAAQAASASGFSLDSIIKLMNAGMSIYAAIQKLATDKARAERGLPPTGTRTATSSQTRTVRDASGRMVTQQLNPMTGQWATTGLAPAGAGATGGGLSAPIGGVPLWVWLAGGGVVLIALTSDKQRRRRR